MRTRNFIIEVKNEEDFIIDSFKLSGKQIDNDLLKRIDDIMKARGYYYNNEVKPFICAE